MQREQNEPVRVAILGHLDPHLFPPLHQLSMALAERGGDVVFMSRSDSSPVEPLDGQLRWVSIPGPGPFQRKIPWYRTGFHHIGKALRAHRPHWIVAQNDYMTPAIFHKIMHKDCKIMVNLTEYQRNRKYISLVKPFAGMIDAYVDSCDIWLKWRQTDWPRLSADYFVARHTPPLRTAKTLERHAGPSRILFTGSKYVLGLDRDRLSRFLSCVCALGHPIDWYLPGTDDVRATARSLTQNPLFAVKEPVEKSHLFDLMSDYDVGLHWAPMAERVYDPDYFDSAASNKIGEYISCGLVVAHAGNPGLSFIPDDICVVYDPTEPEVGARQLAAAISDTEKIFQMRQLTQAYHHEVLNFERQWEGVIQHLMRASS